MDRSRYIIYSNIRPLHYDGIGPQSPSNGDGRKCGITSLPSLVFRLYFDVSSVFLRAWKLPWYLRNLNSNPVFRQSAGHSGSLATEGKVIICNNSPSITPDHSDTLPKEAVA